MASEILSVQVLFHHRCGGNRLVNLRRKIRSEDYSIRGGLSNRSALATDRNPIQELGDATTVRASAGIDGSDIQVAIYLKQFCSPCSVRNRIIYSTNCANHLHGHCWNLPHCPLRVSVSRCVSARKHLF